jgi:predicted nucleic acid-binding protein
MKVFGDTSFYLALLSPSDTDHAKAVDLSRRDDFEVVTSGFVLIELDALAPRRPPTFSGTAPTPPR